MPPPSSTSIPPAPAGSCRPPGPGAPPGIEPDDRGELRLVCANRGARMDERTYTLICHCGSVLSCSDDT